MIKGTYTLDDFTGYEYHMAYSSDFFSPYRSGLELRDVLQRDFITNLGRFLKHVMNIEGETAFSVAHGLYAFMSNNHRHFHTPYWIMWKFHFANYYGIKLEKFEQLAVWFKDAVFVPFSPRGLNESQSVCLMRAMIPYGYRMNDNPIVNSADRAIHRHADHLKEVESDYNNLLDLDLSILAADKTVFESAMLNWRIEYVEMGRRFNSMVRKFFTELVARPFIYRTEKFRRKFEERARGTVKGWLEKE